MEKNLFRVSFNQQLFHFESIDFQSIEALVSFIKEHLNIEREKEIELKCKNDTKGEVNKNLILAALKFDPSNTTITVIKMDFDQNVVNCQLNFYIN